MRLMEKIAVLAVLVSGSVLAQTPDIDPIVTPLMQQYQVPGMAVAIFYRGKTTFYNYGVGRRKPHNSRSPMKRCLKLDR